ncbi:LEPR-XLL domain-containing protein, partial [Methylobacterium aquaticum]
MAFPFTSQGFWGPLFRRRERAQAAPRAAAPRPRRASKRDIIAKLKATFHLALRRDRLIFDPLEPRVLLSTDITVNIATDATPVAAEHQLLVRLIETTAVQQAGSVQVERVQILDLNQTGTNGDPGKVLAFGDIGELRSVTINGSTDKDVITVDAASFATFATYASGATLPSFSILGAGGQDSLVLTSGPSALWTLTGADQGTMSAGQFAASFSGVESLNGASGSSATLALGSGASLSGTFGGVQDVSFDLSGALGSTDSDLTLAASTGGFSLGTTGASSPLVAFEAPTVSLGILLGAGNDTFHVASLPPSVAVSVQGGAGDDTLVVDTGTTAIAGDVDLAFSGGIGKNAANFGTAGIKATGTFAFAADATSTTVLGDSGSHALSSNVDAEMALTLGSTAVIQGTSVDVAVRSRLALNGGEGDTIPALASTLSVNATGSATVTLAGTVTATAGAASIATHVDNAVTLTSLASPQLRSVTPVLSNTSTVAVGAGGAVNGSTVALAADTAASVTVTQLGLVLPGLGTLTSAGSGTAAQVLAVAKGDAALSDVFTPAEQAATGLIKATETSVTNVTSVSVDPAARIVQAAGSPAPADPAVRIAARDRTDVATHLVATDDSPLPVVSDLLNFFALTGNATVSRNTAVTIGTSSAGTLPATGATPVIDAAGGVSLAADNRGAVTTRIGAATPGLGKDAQGIDVTVAGDGETNGSLAAPIKAGAVTNTIDDTVTVAVRGVAVSAGSVAASATNETSVAATAIQARNLLTGATRALAETARITASGTVSFLAMDATEASATAIPVDTASDVDAPSTSDASTLAIGRGSAINTAERTIAAALTGSAVTGRTGVSVQAQNSLTLTAEAAAAAVASTVGVAGSIAANIVLGSTTATIDGGTVQAAASESALTAGGTGDVRVNAIDLSAIDARTRSTASGGNQGGGTAIGGASALNIIGYRLTGIATGALADKLAGTAIDAILGTAFFSTMATQAVSARITAATVRADRTVQANASSAGTVNATVSTSVTSASPEQAEEQKAKDDLKRSALNTVLARLSLPQRKDPSAGSGVSASSRSIGGIIVQNRMARAATAEITGSTVTNGDALTVRGADVATINANVKLVASSTAESDGGLDTGKTRPADFEASASAPVAIALGQRVVLDFPTAIASSPDPVKPGTEDAVDPDAPATPPVPATLTHVVQPGDVILLQEGYPEDKGEAGAYYRYVGTAASAPINLATNDYTDATLWKKIGQKGAVFAYMGPDIPSSAATKLDLKTQAYDDLDLWRPVREAETVQSTATGSGATAAGGMVVRNEIAGGATARIVEGSTITAGSVAVDADRGATITATAEATVEAIATLKDKSDAGDDSADTAGTVSAFDRAQSSNATALAINAVIATNTVNAVATAGIDGGSVTTTGESGDVAVTAETAGSIAATVAAQVTATATGAAGTDSASSGGGATPLPTPPRTLAGAAGVQLAFNAIGYQSSNLAFDTLNAVIGTNLGTGSPSQATATITNADITATATVMAAAQSAGAITADLGNQVTATAEAANAAALAVSGLVAMNRVSGAATATIDGLSGARTVQGAGVAVSAKDQAEIAATTSVGASATATKAGDVTGATKAADQLLGEYDFTTASGTRTVHFGQKIRLGTGWTPTGAGKGEAGAVYQYMGGTPLTNVDLGDTTRDFSDFSLWKKLDESNIVPGGTTGSQPKAGRIDSLGLGLVFDRNEVSGKAQALITGAQVVATDSDVTVAAESGATITASDTSTIEGGKGFGGVAVTNTVLNGASASIAASTVDGGTGLSTGGLVSIQARNTGTIQASATGSVAGETASIGFVLAFNAVGYQQGNILFNAIDTIVGDPLIAAATKAEQPADATASITGTTLAAGGDVAVGAENTAQIGAQVGDEVTQSTAAEYEHAAKTGARGLSAAAILASNKVSGQAQAFIGAPTVAATAPATSQGSVTSAFGGVAVTAANQAGVTSSSSLVSASAVDGVVAEVAKIAEARALATYDYTTKSGTQTVLTGDRVRLAADYNAGNATTKGINGQVYVYVGRKAALDLGATDYSDTTTWLDVAEGVTVTEAPTKLSDTAGTTSDATSITTTTTDAESDTTTRVTKTRARYSSLDGYQYMRVGEAVKLAVNDTESKGIRGAIYVYRGPDNAKVTLKGADYTSADWVSGLALSAAPEIDTIAAPPATSSEATKTDGGVTPSTAPDAFDIPASTAPTPPPASKAFGGLIVMNEVTGGALARVTDASVAAKGDLAVLASDKSDIAATVLSTVTASGGQSFKSAKDPAPDEPARNSGTLIAANGIAVTNVVRGGAEASVLRSSATATDGSLTVQADNQAGVDARLRASSTTSGGENGGVSAAVTLAFNSVGYRTQNLLFNALDALIGSPTLADAFGGEVGSGAKATIVASQVSAGADIAVAANAAATINATVSNAALSSTDSLKGSGGSGFGVVLASNKVSGSATATIDNTALPVDAAQGTDIAAAGGGVRVGAVDANSIASNVQIVTSSTVTESDGGTVTTQSKLNKFLPSDFSTNPNEIQAATIQGNLVRNRRDLFPAELNALEDKLVEQIGKAKDLAGGLFDTLQGLEDKAKGLVDKLASLDATVLAALDGAIGDAIDDVVTKITAKADASVEDDTLKAALEVAKIKLQGTLDDKAEGRKEAIKGLIDATGFGLLRDEALRAGTDAQKRLGELLGQELSVESLKKEAQAQIDQIKERIAGLLAPLGLTLADFGDFDAVSAGDLTANEQTVHFGTRVRIGEDYAKPTFDLRTGASSKVTIETGNTLATMTGEIWKYVGADALSDVRLAAVDLTTETAGKADWVKIAGSDSDYKTGDIFVYMGGSPATLDLAATDFTDKLLWKRSLDSSFIPDDFELPDLGLTPEAPGAETPEGETEAPTGDPSAKNPAAATRPQSATALAIGGLVVLNSVHGDATATIANARVTSGTGAIAVTASETGTIDATADSAATVTSASSYEPTDGEEGASQTRSLALGGVIATNAVLGAASAAVTGATLTGGGGVAVTADDQAGITATNQNATSSDGNAVAVTLAFNTIGWREQNVLFRAVDTLTGDPVIANAQHLDDTPAGARATITGSAVTTGPDAALTLQATDRATIAATLNNDASSSNAALKDASALALGFALSSNLVNTKAVATIDGSPAATSVAAGGAVTVKADSKAEITAENSLSSIASLTKNSLLQDFADKILGNYTYTTSSGTQKVTFGDTVYSEDASGKEKIYVYYGPTATLDLGTATFDSAHFWRENNLREFMKFLPPGILNLGDSTEVGGSDEPAADGSGGSGQTGSKPYAVAVSGILVQNSIRSDATAALTDIMVTHAGDVTVQADQASTITATVTSTVESKLKPGDEAGKTSLALGGVIAGNAILGSASATITGSTLGDTANAGTVGTVTAAATNEAAITATVDSTVESSGTAVGVTLAANKIGVPSQNFLLDLVDALAGTDLATTIQGQSPFTARASIASTPIDATGAVTVSALSHATIASTIENSVSSIGVATTSVGVVSALNLVKLATTADITGGGTVATGGVAVTATSGSAIDADVSAPVTAVVYRLPSTSDAETGGSQAGGGSGGGSSTTTSITVGLSIARNTIVDAALSAAIDGVDSLTATNGKVTVAAQSAAAIHATASATAVAAIVSKESGNNVGFAGGGALGFNTILGGVDAHIANSTIRATGTAAEDAEGAGGSGAVDVSAKNASTIAAKIDATAASVVIGKDSASAYAIGVSLAFNMIGFYGSGLPVANGFGPGITSSLDVSARITKAKVNADRRVSVTSGSTATIDAAIAATAVAVGASSGGGDSSSGNTSLSGAGLYAGNKIVTTVTALIDGTGLADAAVASGAEGVAVKARDVSAISTKARAIAVAANVSGKSSGNGTSVAIGASISNNDIASDVTAAIRAVPTVSGAGTVSAVAERAATITAQTIAASVTAQVSGQGTGFALSGGGAVAVNTIAGSTIAEITDSAAGSASAAVGGVTVSATDTSAVEALTGALSVAAGIASKDSATGVAFGVSASANTVGSGAQVRASLLRSPVKASGAVAVTATTNRTVDATVVAAAIGVAASGSGSSTSVSLSGAGAGNTVGAATVAEIADSASLAASGVTVAASNSSAITANLGALSLAVALGQEKAVSVAIGATVAVNRIAGDVAARVANVPSVTAGAGGVSVSATNSGRIKTVAAAASMAAGVSTSATGVGVAAAGAGAANLIDSTTSALVEGGTITSGGAVGVTADSTLAIQADIVGAAASIGASGGGSGGAGALGIAIAYNQIGSWTAYDAAANRISDTPVQGNRAGVTATLRNARVDAAGALTVAATTTNTVAATIVAVAVALSGGSQNGVGVSAGGTYAQNFIGLATQATIDGDGTGATPGLRAASAAVTAADTSTITTTALSASLAVGAAGDSGVAIAIGVSIALNRIANDVEATIARVDEGLKTTGGGVALTAKSAGTIEAVAASAALSIGGGGSNGVAVSGAGAFASNVITTSTRATGRESQIDSAGDVAVAAEASAAITARIVAASLAAGVGGSNGVGVGIGVAAAENRIGTWTSTGSGQTRRDTLATGGGTVVEASLTRVKTTAAGTLSLGAQSKNTIDALVAAASVAIGGGGDTGVGVAAGGTVVVNAIAIAARAFIEGAGLQTSTIPSNAVTAGAVQISAADTSAIAATAGTASISAGLGGSSGVAVSVGFALALNTIGNTVEAAIADVTDGLSATGAVAVAARSAAAISSSTTAAAVSVGGGGSAGVSVSAGGAFAFNTLLTATTAHVDASRITGSGSLAVTADSTSGIAATVLAPVFAGGGGGSAGVGVGVGISAASNQIGDWSTSGSDRDRTDTLAAGGESSVLAKIGGSSVASTGALAVTATSNQAIKAQVVAASAAIGGGGSAGVGVAAAGVGVTNAIGVVTRAVIDGDGATGISAGSVALDASDRSSIQALAGSASLAGSGGGAAGVSVAVGFTLALNTVSGTVEAAIRNADTGVTARTGDVSVTASRAGSIEAAAAAAALTVAGGGAAGVGVSGGGAGASNVILGSVDA